MPEPTESAVTIDAFVPKGWGFEHVVVNAPGYCGKRMFVLAGRKCSWHYHKVKDETFCIQEGCLELTFGYGNCVPKGPWLDMTWKVAPEPLPPGKVILEPGEVFHVPVGMRHQFKALCDTWLLEFSTNDDPADSIRIVRGDTLPAPLRDGTPRLRLHPDGITP